MKLLDSLHCNIVYYNEAKKTGLLPGIKGKRLERRERQSKREREKQKTSVFLSLLPILNQLISKTTLKGLCFDFK